MSIPLIGISGSIDSEEKKHFLLRDYMRSVADAGGVPLLLSLDMTAAELLACVDGLDGLMLAGGNDVSPERFGQEPDPALGEVSPLRDALEMRAIRAFLQAEKPIFGICRGIQSLNVALGGDLWQDVPTGYRREDGGLPVPHQQTAPGSVPCHDVAITEGSLLRRVVGADRLAVNSFHHQAVRRVAPGCRICAIGEDGVIEGIELPGPGFVLAVQWHPERMTPADPAARKLFEAFVEAAGNAAAWGSSGKKRETVGISSLRP